MPHEGHHHDHDHDHDHDHAPIESLDSSNSESALLAEAVRTLLIDKGYFTAQDVTDQITASDARGVHVGAKIIARAWCDPGFKARLLADGNQALRELGHDLPSLHFLVVENTPAVHNVIVCTLCSCYPVLLLGPSPEWYKSKAYRSRTVWDPRSVLKEFGTDIPLSREVRVHDSTADMRYMVLPMRPEGTKDLNEEQLAALITQNGLIGTSEL